jgi:hypothetical protein
MSSFHHKPIKRFGFQGKIYDDAAIGRLRNEYRKLVTTEMTLSGYVPRLDIAEDFTIEYNYETQYFEFKISIHGIYVGKRQSEWIIGVDGATPIYTQKSKLKEYSQDRA